MLELTGDGVAERHQLLLIIAIGQKESDIALASMEGMVLVEIGLIAHRCRC